MDGEFVNSYNGIADGWSTYHSLLQTSIRSFAENCKCHKLMLSANLAKRYSPLALLCVLSFVLVWP